MSGLDRLNALPAPEAEAAFRECCGSREWARRMAGRRPFRSREALMQAADEEWWSLPAGDWLEAFRSHPRIGERRAAAATTERERRWSAGEQGRMAAAGEDARAALAAGNAEYEERFGYTYVVRATGRSAEEMAALLRERLRNDPADEIRTAAAEQAAITRLRLDKLLDALPSPGTPP